MALNCWVRPAATERPVGVTVTAVTVALVTVSVVLPLTLPLVAVIFVLPLAMVVARPAVDIVAIVVFELAHVTVLVIADVEPSE